MTRRPPGALEQSVLLAIQSADQALSVAEVTDRLDGRPAYTTIMTTLARLHDKGALTRASRGRGYVYALAADQDALPAAQTARRMRRLLEAQGRRADVLNRFVAELTADDEQLLLEALRSNAESSSPAGGAS